VLLNLEIMRTLLDKFHRLLVPRKDPATIKREFGLPDNIDLQFRITDDGWFAVVAPELPGLVTQARSQQELIEMVNDAILSYFDVPKSAGDIVYNKIKLGNNVIQYEGQLQTA